MIIFFTSGQYFTLPGVFHMDSIWNGWNPSSFHGIHMECCIIPAKIKNYTMEDGIHME
jgi:hypothetical protein